MYIQYRSYKNFSEQKLLDNIEVSPFSEISNISDCDSSYKSYSNILQDIFEKSAPVKQKVIKKQQIVTMNSQLRKAIFKKNMLQHMLMKIRDKNTEEKFHFTKNLVTSLKWNSIGKYFKNKCTNGSRNIHLWKTIKPFMNEAYSSNSYVPEMLLKRENS